MGFKDGYKILNTYDADYSKVKHISEFTGNYVPLEEYPYPGNNVNFTKSNYSSQMLYEIENISDSFIRLDATVDDQYRHPAGIRQYLEDPQTVLTDEEIFNNSKRTDIQVIIYPDYGPYHFTDLYAPPGELITVEIPESLTDGSLILEINPHIERTSLLQQRLTNMSCSITLDRSVSHIVWPYGGALFIKTVNNVIDPESGAKIIVRGGVLCPHFTLGIDTDEDFDKQIQERVGPFSFLDGGNYLIFVNTYRLRINQHTINDGYYFFRSATTYLNRFTHIWNGLLTDGYVTNPNR